MENLREQRILKDMGQYHDFIQKMSWQYWRTLPQATKFWVDREDLVEEIYVYVMSRVQKKWDKNRSSKMTFLWTGVNNLMLNYTGKQQTKKRSGGWRLELTSVSHMGKADETVEDLALVNSLEKVFGKASPELQDYIAKWFGPSKPRALQTLKTKQAYREFRLLAKRYNLTYDGCLKLMRNGYWIG